MAEHVPPKACPDCGGTLEAVLLFGRGPQSPVGAAVAYYAQSGAAPSLLMQMYDPATISARFLIRQVNDVAR